MILQTYFPKIFLNHFISLFEVLKRTVVFPGFPLWLLFFQLSPCVQPVAGFLCRTGISSSFRCGLGFLQQNLRHWIYKNSGFNGDTASGQRRSSAFKEGPRTRKTPGNYTLMTEAPTSHMFFSCLHQMGIFGCGLLVLSWFLSPCPPHRLTLEFFSCLDTASAVNYSHHIFCFFFFLVHLLTGRAWKAKKSLVLI